MIAWDGMQPVSPRAPSQHPVSTAAHRRAAIKRLRDACLASRSPGERLIALAASALGAPHAKDDTWRPLVELALCLLVRDSDSFRAAAIMAARFEGTGKNELLDDFDAPPGRGWLRARAWVFLANLDRVAPESLVPVMDWLDAQSKHSFCQLGLGDVEANPIAAHTHVLSSAELRKRAKAARNGSVRWIYERAQALKARRQRGRMRLFSNDEEYRYVKAPYYHSR